MSLQNMSVQHVIDKNPSMAKIIFNHMNIKPSSILELCFFEEERIEGILERPKYMLGKKASGVCSISTKTRFDYIKGFYFLTIELLVAIDVVFDDGGTGSHYFPKCTQTILLKEWMK